MSNRGAAIAPSQAQRSAASSSESLSDRVRSLQLPPDAPSAIWRPVLAWVLIVGAIGGTVATWVWWPQIVGLAQVPAAKPTDTATTATPVETNKNSVPPAAPVAASGDVVLESKGYIIPSHQILVSPKVSGMIVSLNIEEGRRVTKGDVLAQVETVDYKADVERAKAMLAASKHKLLELERGNRPAEIAQVKAELAEATAQRDQLLSQWKRNTTLRNKGVLTENDYEQSESQYKAMEARVARLSHSLELMIEGPRVERIEVARAEVGQFEADLAKAEWRFDNCTIRSPVTGTILKKNAEEGNIVNPIAMNGSFSLCEMADLSDIEVELSIQERDIAKVHQGQACKVRSEAYPERVYEGVVSRLMPIADRAKGAVPVRVKLSVPVEEEGVYLKPEMGAVVSFLKTDVARSR